MKRQVIHPKEHILDNEAPQEYLETIKAEGLDWELVPPTNHRRLIAERAIQTAKGHVIANVLGCDESYPVREWHRLIPQMELTLNMLRPSNMRPTISAYNYVYGVHDYNKMPIAPLGCKTQCFVDPDNRRLFGAHSVDSHYLGHSSDHYQVARVLVTETNLERLTDTIVYFHKRITSPRVSMADAVTVAAAGLAGAIKDNLKENLAELDLKELELERLDAAAPRVEKPQQQVEAEAEAPRVPKPAIERGKEIGRFAQGQEGVVEGTNAIFFIPHQDIPAEREGGSKPN